MAIVFEDDFEVKLATATSYFRKLFAQTQPIDEIKEISFMGGNVRIKTVVTAGYEIQAILSTADDSPLEVSLRRKDEAHSYRWVSPYYGMLRHTALNSYDVPTVEFETQIPNEVWVETDTLGDIQNKIEATIRGEPLDGKVDVLLDLDSEDLEKLKKLAKKAKLPFDEYLERLLLLEIKRLDKKSALD